MRPFASLRLLHTHRVQHTCCAFNLLWARKSKKRSRGLSPTGRKSVYGTRCVRSAEQSGCAGDSRSQVTVWGE